jgi:hypothetical protein
MKWILLLYVGPLVRVPVSPFAHKRFTKNDIEGFCCNFIKQLLTGKSGFVKKKHKGR